MPVGFTDDEFLETFKKVYPGLWQELRTLYTSDVAEYRNRVKKGRKGMHPIAPDVLIMDVARSSMKKARSAAKTTEEANAERERNLKRLLSKGLKKERQLKKREQEKKRHFQLTHPPYIRNMIREYFRIRKDNPLDINSRYLIILECAKFKCGATISFLEKINACDKNDDLRQLAFRYLQRFGLHPRLRKHRKGKRRLTAIKRVDIEENPSELLRMIYDSQHNILQSFDVFISHSYKDQEDILKLKDILNHQGLYVYVDWINDSEMLTREKQNCDTFNVLFERMRQSSTLLFVYSTQSISSANTAKEVSFYKTLDRPMFMLESPTEIPASPFDGMSRAFLESDKILIEAMMIEFH